MFLCTKFLYRDTECSPLLDRGPGFVLGGGGMHLCNISKPNRLEKLSFGVCPVSHFALGKVTFTGPAVCSSCCVQSPKYPLPICMGNIRDCMERQEALKKAVRDCVESSLNSPTGGDYSLQL